VLALTTHSRLDRDGNVGEMIVYGRDMTAEHEHQARQQQQDKLRALGEMAGGMAHEINNALQPLVGMLGMLGERVGQYDAKLAAQVEMLENHALHARNIVGDVLAFARSGGPQTESVPVTDVLAEVTDFVDRLLPSRVRVERRGFPPDTPAVPPDTRVDVSRNGMIQVLQNLMTNAADAMDGRGTMVVSLHQADGQDTSDTVTIAVTDHGPGMDEVTRRDVFNPFYSTKPVGEGTGLGLSVVYGIVTNWGGGVDIESTLGKGTTVRIHLPIVTADDPEHADA
jgi:signal transduction histidine kinase